MDIYTVNANDLLTYVRQHKQQQLFNTANAIAKKSKKKVQENDLIIDTNYLSNVCFTETLCVVDENGKEQGEFIGKIRTYGSNSAGPKSMMINLQSTSVSDDGNEIGMTVITNTTSSFDSCEEKWSQWYVNKSESVRKVVLVSKKSGGKTLDVCTELNDNGLVDQSKNVDSKYITGLLTEGMNYAYLRYLAVKGFEGSIKSKTAITINGKLYRVIYKCSLCEKYEINKVNVPVVIIQRILIDEKSSITRSPQHTMTTVLTRSGYTLKHFWGENAEGVNRELIIGKSMRIMQDGYVSGDTIPDVNLSNNWDQDIRLKSVYLDKVSETRAKYKNYFKNNRAVKDMIVDYIKEILIIKPENVLQFSIDYFDVR